MTVAGRQRPGQNPAYTPADRPNRVFSTVSQAFRMAVCRRTGRPRLLSAASYLGLALVIIVCISLESRVTYVPGDPANICVTGESIYGCPIPWLEVHWDRPLA